MKDAITKLKPLILGRRIESNSADNSGISGSLADRIAKTLIRGEEKKSGTDSERGIKKAKSDFAKQSKMGRPGRGTI